MEALANKVISELNSLGIECYLWHKATTGSVYIRFKDVRMGSIRIGDHPGRDKLKYKFNLRNDMGLSVGKWIKNGDNWRYYAPFEKWKELIPVLQKRFQDVQTWGPSKYQYTIPSFKK